MRKFERETVDIAINIPSGKIAYDDDLREQYPVEYVHYVNNIVGIKNTIEDYGKLGLFYGYVGNSCPSIYKEGNLLRIGNPKYDEHYKKIVEKIPGEKVGYICTDLWWYSLADYDDYISRGGNKKIDTFDVEPGRYVLKHRLSRSGWDNPPVVYATIEKSDEPVVSWKLPEEGVASEIYKLLPKIKNEKEDKYVFVDAKHKEEKFLGFQIWGSLGSDYEHNFSFLVKIKELKDTQKLADQIVQKVEKRKKREKRIDKIGKLLGKGENDPALLKEYDKLNKESLAEDKEEYS